MIPSILMPAVNKNIPANGLCDDEACASSRKQETAAPARNVIATADKSGSPAPQQDAGKIHQRLEQERDELLGRLQLQFERLPFASIICDPAMRIVDWNPAAEKTFGFRKKEMLGMDAHLLVPPEGRPYTRELHRRLASGDMTAHGINEILTSDGRTILCQWCNTPLLDADGKVIAIMSIAQDVTEATQTQEKLRRSESMLAEAQQLAHIGSWNWDMVTGEHFWSAETCRIFGLSPQEKSLSYGRFLSLVHPDDRARVENEVQKAIRDGKPYDCPKRIVRPDGTVRHIDTWGRVIFDDGGKPVRMFGTNHDVTDRKRADQALRESEERVRLLLESTAEAICGMDADGNCTFCNPAALRMLGYRQAADLLGQSMHGLIHHTRRDGTPNPREACRILQAFLQGREVHTDDEVFWRADGTSFPVEYWSHPVRHEGKIVGAVVTFLDITERKRLEREIIEISEREQRRIGQDLHDDLCQQLTGIAFTTRLLQQRLKAGSSSESAMAGEIVEAVQQATARARDLAKGLHPVRLEAEGLAAALRELTATVESVFHVSCRLRTAGRAALRECDRTVAIQLYRIAQEAATNAVKHGQAKNIRISIGLVKGRIKMTVADDGVGINDSPSQQGMGLPVMYQRARIVGAALTIKRRKRGGTLVICWLDGKLGM